MKALLVNGSPRKKWATAQMLERTEKGLRDAGAETEWVNLYDFSFKGCISCFACKRKDSKIYGHCAFHDPLTPVLEKAMTTDIIVIGSPIVIREARHAHSWSA